MAKENNIINFRATPEARQKLEQLKQEQGIRNVSAFINGLIVDYQNRDDGHTLVRTIPDEAVTIYGNKAIGLLQSVKLSSKPFCDLNIRKHAEAKSVIEANGMGYYYFHIHDDLYMAIIACNQEEASIQFQRYYTYDREGNKYVRTSLPLPQYRYDAVDKNVIIIEYGE